MVKIVMVKINEGTESKRLKSHRIHPIQITFQLYLESSKVTKSTDKLGNISLHHLAYDVAFIGWIASRDHTCKNTFA